MQRSLIVFSKRIAHLVECMKNDIISFPENVAMLKKQVEDYTNDMKFKECKNMGEILENILFFVKRNYLDISRK